MSEPAGIVRVISSGASMAYAGSLGTMTSTVCELTLRMFIKSFACCNTAAHPCGSLALCAATKPRRKPRLSSLSSAPSAGSKVSFMSVTVSISCSPSRLEMALSSPCVTAELLTVEPLAVALPGTVIDLKLEIAKRPTERAHARSWHGEDDTHATRNIVRWEGRQPQQQRAVAIMEARHTPVKRLRYHRVPAARVRLPAREPSEDTVELLPQPDVARRPSSSLPLRVTAPSVALWYPRSDRRRSWRAS